MCSFSRCSRRSIPVRRSSLLVLFGSPHGLSTQTGLHACHEWHLMRSDRGRFKDSHVPDSPGAFHQSVGRGRELLQNFPRLLFYLCLIVQIKIIKSQFKWVLPSSSALESGFLAWCSGAGCPLPDLLKRSNQARSPGACLRIGAFLESFKSLTSYWVSLARIPYPLAF